MEERRGEIGVIARIGGAATAPLGGLSRTFGGINREIQMIADSVRVLPALLETLVDINRRAISLDDEVRRMRQSVDNIHSDIALLTQHVDDLGNSLHPLGRIRNRLRRDGESAAKAAAAEEPD